MTRIVDGRRDGHLSREALARMVEESPTGLERAHIEACSLCSAELDALGHQTAALRGLRSIEPSPEDWEKLEARLQGEGLVDSELRDAGTTVHANHSRALGGFRGWLRVAAVLVVFLSGAGSGWLLADERIGRRVDRTSVGSVVETVRAGFPDGGDISLEEAEELIQLTQGLYSDALRLYRDRVGPELSSGDPIGRFVALENVLAATEAAVREAPADPFFNGLLVSTVAEHEAAMEGIAFTATGIW